VALSACAHPGESGPSFELEPNEVEFGVGIHGERGIERRPFERADTIAQWLTDPVADALALASGDRVLAIVNGLGSTHPLELSVIYRAVAERLQERGVDVARSLVGPYLTALDMAGVSVTLVRVDDELLELWDAPVKTPALSW
jgi:dihydroxyacetone kinase-like protein